MNYRGINHDFAQQGRIYYFTLFVSRLGLAAWCWLGWQLANLHRLQLYYVMML